MRTQRQPPEKSLDVQIWSSIQCDFRGTAAEIVRQVRDVLARSLTGNLKRALDRLERADIDRIIDDISAAFTEKKMGLRGLASMARKDLAMLLIKRSVRKYRADMMQGDPGIEPLEYFERFYKEHFLRCDVPAKGISVVDANLHALLRKKGQFPAITQSLDNG